MNINNIEKEYYVYNSTYTITPWMPRGIYKWLNIKLTNE